MARCNKYLKKSCATCGHGTELVHNLEGCDVMGYKYVLLQKGHNTNDIKGFHNL